MLNPDSPIKAPPPHDWQTTMALPAATQYGILPTEMEFVASSETPIQILPLVTVDKFRLLSGTYGPFRPPSHAEVPLWLALSLRKKRKCVIIPPDWLTVGTWTIPTQTPFQILSVRKHSHYPLPLCPYTTLPCPSFYWSSTCLS